VALLERRLKQDKVDATVVNASISGETTIGGRNRLPALLKQYHPALVVIELGANDGLRGLPLKDAEANLRAMVDASRQAGAKPMLVGIRIPPNYGRDYTDKLAGLYPALAHEYKLPVVPFMLQGVADKPNLFQDDQLHPLAQAHPIILANIWPVLSKALASR
jgi:acyl-CoA thioesterase-1